MAVLMWLGTHMALIVEHDHLAEYATDRPSLKSLTDETDPNDGKLKLLIAAEGCSRF